MHYFKSLFGHSNQKEGQNPQVHIINGKSYQELSLIAEGGYGYVWRALDLESKKIVIVKKQLCQNEESIRQTKQEQYLHKQLGTHPHIVKCLDGSIIRMQHKTYAVTVMEFCEGGTLFDWLSRHRDKSLTEDQILFILRHLISGLKHMHQQKPPIAHRDLKVENILLHEKVFKLCDFGSASNQVVNLATVSKLEASRHEEIFQKNTTMMYRPPEMSDIYQKYEVNEKVDIWMLGCILYTLCFYEHPFQDASTLAIIQADYKVPKPHKYSHKMIQLLNIMLTPQPSERPSITAIEHMVFNYAKVQSIEHINEVNHKHQDQVIDDFDEFQQAPNQQSSSDLINL